MLQRAEEALDELDKPHIVFIFGGRDNVYNERELTLPSIEVKRNVLTMSGVAFDKLPRIVEKDPDVSGAHSMVASLEAGILATAEVLRTTETSTTEEG